MNQRNRVIQIAITAGDSHAPHGLLGVLLQTVCKNDVQLTAGELLPQQIYEEGEKNHIRISYKKEILYGEEITGVYIQHEDRHVVGLTDTNKGVRAIVELW